jgi:hypothetical protein
MNLRNSKFEALNNFDKARISRSGYQHVGYQETRKSGFKSDVLIFGCASVWNFGSGY